MSLIRVRRERKKNWLDTKKGPPVRVLIVVLALVLALLWYLGSAF